MAEIKTDLVHTRSRSQPKEYNGTVTVTGSSKDIPWLYHTEYWQIFILVSIVLVVGLIHKMDLKKEKCWNDNDGTKGQFAT